MLDRQYLLRESLKVFNWINSFQLHTNANVKYYTPIEN